MSNEMMIEISAVHYCKKCESEVEFQTGATIELINSGSGVKTTLLESQTCHTCGGYMFVKEGDEASLFLQRRQDSDRCYSLEWVLRVFQDVTLQKIDNLINKYKETATFTNDINTKNGKHTFAFELRRKYQNGFKAPDRRIKKH
ncbi:MAG: hypothetical protein GY928_33860 [Colwellia sp.]|nr:hypothetical protein [Colwellia sp.]